MSSCSAAEAWYNRVMTDKEQVSIEEYNDAIKAQKCISVLEYKREHSCSTATACEAVGLAESTFYYWRKQGKLQVYMEEATAETRAALVSVGQAQAVLALPDVMEYMIALATGEEIARGASPIRAAEFVMKMAGISGAGSGGGAGETNINILNLLPQQVNFGPMEGGRPTLDEQGRIIVPAAEIIEGEAIEIEDSQ